MIGAHMARVSVIVYGVLALLSLGLYRLVVGEYPTLFGPDRFWFYFTGSLGIGLAVALGSMVASRRWEWAVRLEKSFKVDIGEFFIAQCCEEAGYDHQGKHEDDAQAEAAGKAPEGAITEPEAGATDASSTEANATDVSEAGAAQAVETENVITLSRCSQKVLQALCDKRGIEYKGNDSKVKLIEKLK